jgi:hypothetical protein
MSSCGLGEGWVSEEAFDPISVFSEIVGEKFVGR